MVKFKELHRKGFRFWRCLYVLMKTLAVVIVITIIMVVSGIFVFGLFIRDNFYKLIGVKKTNNG